jgi:hypothetical protein
MARLFDKFLAVRRDGSVPEWPYLVIGARDPAAPAALRAYAAKASELGMGADFTDDVLRLADSFDEYRLLHGEGDPDAPAHRADDPATVERMRSGSTPDGWRLKAMEE